MVATVLSPHPPTYPPPLTPDGLAGGGVSNCHNGTRAFREQQRHACKGVPGAGRTNLMGRGGGVYGYVGGWVGAWVVWVGR